MVRAIAIVTGGDYRAVRKAMANAMGEHGYTLTGKESARQFGFERVHMPPGLPARPCRRRT